ncbi:MAG: hypothetical protein HS113_14990 [Verrucomicrobiales bacterium]|nr:hypothetical protein [Verrucomicrobiales bacterium]
MLTETNLKTFEIVVSIDPKNGLHFEPAPDVQAGRGDHIVWKSTEGDLVLFIAGQELDARFARNSPFVKYLYCDGRQGGQGEAVIRPQVRANADAGTYKYTLLLFANDGTKYEVDPRIVIR